MEIKDLKIDSETANLIIQIYQKINTLNHYLEKEPYPKLRQILESGATINQLLDQATNQTDVAAVQLKLDDLSNHLKNLISNTNNIESPAEKVRLQMLFEELSANLKILQIKINSEK